MWGFGWAVSICCRSIMVVCIPRVFSVIACIWWWVYLVLLDGGVVFVLLFELFPIDFFSSCGWVGVILSVWLVLGVSGVVLVCAGPEASSIFMVLGACVVSDVCHALHWNMFSWLGCETSVFRCPNVVLFLRGEGGGLILGFISIVSIGVVGVGVCGVVIGLLLTFLFGRVCGGVGVGWR